MIRLALAALLLTAPAGAAGGERPFTTGVFDVARTVGWTDPLNGFSRWAVSTKGMAALKDSPSFVGLFASGSFKPDGTPGMLAPLIKHLPADQAFRVQLSRVDKLPPEEQKALAAKIDAARRAAQGEVAAAAAALLDPVLEQKSDLGGLEGIRKRREQVEEARMAAVKLSGIYGGDALGALRKRAHEKSESVQKALVLALIAHGAGDWNTVGLDDGPEARAFAGTAVSPSPYFDELKRQYKDLAKFAEKAGPKLLKIPGVRRVSPRANFLANAADPTFELEIAIDPAVEADDDKLVALMLRLDKVPGMSEHKFEIVRHEGAAEPQLIAGNLALELDPPSDDRVTFGPQVEAAHRPPFLAAVRRQFDKIEDELSGKLDPSHVRVHAEASWREPSGALGFLGEITVAKRSAVPVRMTIGADGRLIVERRGKTASSAN